MTKQIKVEFAPGCFDSFEGTQDEIDSLMAEIVQMAESGELIENMLPLDYTDIDDIGEELIETLLVAENINTGRSLQ